MKQKQSTIEKYNRASRNYDRLEMPIETILFGKLRRSLLPSLSGKVLEVGIGTGKNLPYYSPETALIGIDFSPGMLEKARTRLEAIELPKARLMQMDVQDLQFADDNFDAIVSTFVFCTVPDPIKGLKEVYRVLKPGGKAVFVEHMKTDYAPVNLLLYLMNGVSTRILGTSMIRETQHNIEQVGLKITVIKRLLFGVVRIIEATK